MSRHLGNTTVAVEAPLFEVECTAEEALSELKRRGREMREIEREAYIRRAMQMVDPRALADRLIARVPSLTDPSADEEADERVDEQPEPQSVSKAEGPAPKTGPAPHTSLSPGRRTPKQSAELLADLTLPEIDE